MTPRSWVPLLVAAASLAVAAAGSAAAPAGPASPVPSARAGGEAAGVTKTLRRHRPGCSRYCQQAGGFGGGPDETMAPVTIDSQRIRVGSDGLIAVQATCTLDVRCDGAILVNNRRFEYGRADLRIAAQRTRKILVAVSDEGLAYLARHGADSRAFATVPLKDPDTALSISDRLTILPPR